MTPASVVCAARHYLGVPWRHLGRGRLGLDCVGLVLVVLRDLGEPAEDAARYPLGARGAELVAALTARGGRRIPLDLAADGDVCAFADGRFVAHLGIRSTWRGVPAVIHAAALRRQVVEEPLADDLAGSLRQVWRLPGMEG